MTLTDEQLEPTAAPTGNDDAQRQRITDVNAWLNGLDSSVAPRCMHSANC
jgi:hypothetical protein